MVFVGIDMIVQRCMFMPLCVSNFVHDKRQAFCRFSTELKPSRIGWASQPRWVACAAGPIAFPVALSAEATLPACSSLLSLLACYYGMEFAQVLRPSRRPGLLCSL
eukprot:5259200-Amphidinium_carterae.1